MTDLSEVIANWRSDARVLERRGAVREAELLDRCASEAMAAAEHFITWLSEPDAVLHSGRTKDWLRKYFAKWMREGNARWNPTNRRERQYRQVILPRRRDIEEVRANAREEAQKAG